MSLLASPGAPTSLAAHTERHGALPRLRGRSASVIAAVEVSGLRGRGGAGFPTHLKLRAVAGRRRVAVVANGVEGEPASHKDVVLMASNPHLVLDGAAVAAAAVGASRVVVAVGRRASAARSAISAAIAERGDATELVVAPDRFVAGEETALVGWLNGGEAKPTGRRPWERGLDGRPTLVHNVETLACLGLVARSADARGLLFTFAGAVPRAGVLERPSGLVLRDVLGAEVAGDLQAVLVGGYFGTWLRASDALDVPFSRVGLGRLGAALGARSIIALPADRCGVVETARIVSYLARESAGQCGPCAFGLPAIAEAFATIASCAPGGAAAVERLRALAPQVAGRGACAHPTGAVRLVASALDVFAGEIRHHLSGVCTAASSEPLVPIPSTSQGWR